MSEEQPPKFLMMFDRSEIQVEPILNEIQYFAGGYAKRLWPYKTYVELICPMTIKGLKEINMLVQATGLPYREMTWEEFHNKVHEFHEEFLEWNKINEPKRKKWELEQQMKANCKQCHPKWLPTILKCDIGARLLNKFKKCPNRDVKQ